jgi:hypothetical protein
MDPSPAARHRCEREIVRRPAQDDRIGCGEAMNREQFSLAQFARLPVVVAAVSTAGERVFRSG